MSWGLGIVAGLALVLGFFWVLQWLSDGTYKPSKNKIKEILEASIEGRLELNAFDEFSCVRIAYDKRLERIRKRYNQIVENPAYIEREITGENEPPLNEQGKVKLRELIDELERLSL